MTGVIHIASILVRVQPQQLQALTEAMRTLDGLELHAIDPVGKLVAVLEAQNEWQIVEALDCIQQQPGVYAANLVYHHMESADSLAQELDNGFDPP